MLNGIISQIFYIYFLILILRIFLAWIPNINWYSQPAKFVRDITDPYLDIFRRIVPPMGGIDFSPILALLVLQLMEIIITTALDFVF